MQVSDPNNVKIYNLSTGKSLPDWLSERKRRALLKKDVDIRRRIQLIQDFDMPGPSTSVKISRDGQYILATGIYKPRVKCFDVNNLSLKFERCFDSEAVTFEVLSDDYSKLVFLQCDRYLEFHAGYGRYYRLRIPKYGRDIKYHFPTCDLFVVGASSDIYRLNLERGQFQIPYITNASSINKCEINNDHGLLFFGTEDGIVEAWDSRAKTSVAKLDCALTCFVENESLQAFPSISALKSSGALQLGVGTATGQILLYDVRCNKPFYVKDHMYGLPIKDIEFHYQEDLVFSMDSSVLKIWDKNKGTVFTTIEASTEFNNLCTIPNSGLIFIANENTKIQTYYIPSLGPAPKWASFLDSLTEELEESNADNLYDDYKFVTKQDLESFGLEHLIGTNLLRAYMHGFFLDVRLYKKAKSLAEPYEFDNYRKKKIRDAIEKDRGNRVQIKDLPKVNKELALKLMNNQTNKKKKVRSNSLLNDDRFKELFDNPSFEVDKNADEYRLLNPVLSRLDKVKKKVQCVKSEADYKKNSDESDDSNEDDMESSDDEYTWTQEMKKQHQNIQKEHKRRDLEEKLQADVNIQENKQFKLYELREGEEFKGLNNSNRKVNKEPLGDRLDTNQSSMARLLGSGGIREMTFSTRRRRNLFDERNKKHKDERKKIVRPFHFKSRYKASSSGKSRK